MNVIVRVAGSLEHSMHNTAPQAVKGGLGAR